MLRFVIRSLATFACLSSVALAADSLRIPDSGTPAATPGKFANVTSIQRLATRGGVEPTVPCNESIVGNEARVPYTAEYYFYKRK